MARCKVIPRQQYSGCESRDFSQSINQRFTSHQGESLKKTLYTIVAAAFVALTMTQSTLANNVIATGSFHFAYVPTLGGILGGFGIPWL